MKFFNKLMFICFTVLLLVLTACGGDDDANESGFTAEADGKSMSDAVIAGVSNQRAFDVAFAAFSALGALGGQAGGQTAASDQVSTAAVIECGGTVEPVFSAGSTTGFIRFTNYCISGFGEFGTDQLTLNGIIDIIANDPSLTLMFDNVTVTYSGITDTLNVTVEINMDSGDMSIVTSGGGQSYSVKDLVVSTSGQNVTVDSGTLVTPDFGEVSISTISDLVFNGCATGNPMSGTLRLMSTSGVYLDVIYNSCSEFQYCYNGSSVMCTVVSF